VNLKGKKVYISGAISSDPNFVEKFNLAEIRVMDLGTTVCLNPVRLPKGWSYEEYMEHCLLMVKRADCLVMLPDWKVSPGARCERAYAESLRKEIYYL
jgi:hypothetical protein